MCEVIPSYSVDKAGFLWLNASCQAFNVQFDFGFLYKHKELVINLLHDFVFKTIHFQWTLMLPNEMEKETSHHIYTSGKRWSIINLFLPSTQLHSLLLSITPSTHTDLHADIRCQGCSPQSIISYCRRFLLIILALTQMSLP